MAIDRRKFLSTSAVAACAATWSVTRALASPDDGLRALFDAFYAEDIRNNPEQAARLGLDKGANADLKARLNDNSPAGIAATKTRTAGQLARLKAFDTSGLSGADRVNYETVLYTKQS